MAVAPHRLQRRTFPAVIPDRDRSLRHPPIRATVRGLAKVAVGVQGAIDAAPALPAHERLGLIRVVHARGVTADRLSRIPHHRTRPIPGAAPMQVVPAASPSACRVVAATIASGCPCWATP